MKPSSGGLQGTRHLFSSTHHLRSWVHTTCLVSPLRTQTARGRECVSFPSWTLSSRAWYTSGAPRIVTDVNWNSTNECLEPNSFRNRTAACICIYGGEREGDVAEGVAAPSRSGERSEDLRRGSQVALFPSLALQPVTCSAQLCPWGTFSAISNWSLLRSHSKALSGTFADRVFKQPVSVAS